MELNEIKNLKKRKMEKLLKNKKVLLGLGVLVVGGVAYYMYDKKRKTDAQAKAKAMQTKVDTKTAVLEEAPDKPLIKHTK
jgi:hypothetical protein